MHLNSMHEKVRGMFLGLTALNYDQMRQKGGNTSFIRKMCNVRISVET